MTQDQFKTLLESKYQELMTSRRSREAIAVERSADELDQIQSLNEREIQTNSIDMDARLLRQVKAALKRMRDGDYGICIDCDEPMTPKRLLAIPWAERCVGCQEKIDLDSKNHTVLLQEEDAA